MGRTDSLEKTLVLGKIEGRWRRGRQRMRWLDGIMELIDMSLSKLQSWWWTGKSGVLQSMGSHSRTQLSDWTGLIYPDVPVPFIEWSVFSPLTWNTIFTKFFKYLCLLLDFLSCSYYVFFIEVCFKTQRASSSLLFFSEFSWLLMLVYFSHKLLKVFSLKTKFYVNIYWHYINT